MDTQRTAGVIEPSLRRFAIRLREDVGATRVLLFGSRATRRSRPDSDYDLIIVAPVFAKQARWERGRGLRQLFWEAGGRGPMDLICLTPEEFEQARSRISFVAAVLPEAIDLLASEQPAA